MRSALVNGSGRFDPELELIIDEQLPVMALRLRTHRTAIDGVSAVCQRVCAAGAPARSSWTICNGSTPAHSYCSTTRWRARGGLLLVVGAYRDHETSLSHPSFERSRIRSRGIRADEIALPPLSHDHPVGSSPTRCTAIDSGRRLWRCSSTKAGGNPSSSFNSSGLSRKVWSDSIQPPRPDLGSRAHQGEGPHRQRRRPWSAS